MYLRFAQHFMDKDYISMFTLYKSNTLIYVLSLYFCITCTDYRFNTTGSRRITWNFQPSIIQKKRVRAALTSWCRWPPNLDEASHAHPIQAAPEHDSVQISCQKRQPPCLPGLEDIWYGPKLQQKSSVEADKQLLEAMRVKILQSKTNLWIKRRWVEAWSNTRLLDAPSHVPFVIQLLQMNANDVFPLRLWVLLQVLQPCEIDSNIVKQHRAILCVGRKSLHAAYTPQVALHPSVHTSHCNLATYWTMAPDERSNFFLHEKNIQLKPDTSWHLSNWVYPGNPFVGLVRIPLTWIVP